MNLLKNLPKATHTIQKIAKVTNILHSGHPAILIGRHLVVKWRSSSLMPSESIGGQLGTNIEKLIFAIRHLLKNGA